MSTKTSSRTVYAKWTVFESVHTRPPSGSDGNHSNTYTSAVDVTDSRTGVSNPKWRAQIKSGANATTNMTGTRFRVLALSPLSAGGTVENGDSTNGSTAITEVNGIFQASITLPSPGYVGVDPVASDNQALSQAFDRLRQQSRHAQGLVFLGELRETLKFLKSPFKGAREMIEGYFKQLSKMKTVGGRSRGRKASRRTIVQEAGNTWLEVAFGLKPLINDVKDIAEAAARFQHDSRRTVIVSNGSSQKGFDGGGSTTIGNYVQVVQHWHELVECQTRYKCALDYRSSAEFGSMERLQSLSGFALEDFVPAVYELIPWSFLVDYFSNLGQVIEGGCTNTSNVAWTNKTVRMVRTRTSSYSLGANVSPGYTATLDSNGDAVIQRSDITRTAGSNLSVPTLTVSLPGSPMKYANMFALWAASERKILS